MNTERELLIDEVRGIYIPQHFYKTFNFSVWGLETKDYKALNHPDNKNYWNAWDDLLREAKHTDKHGNEWRLVQDGDLFAERVEE